MRRQDRVLGASRWTNIMLAPPSEAMGALIGTMSQNQTLCDEFTENFNYPERQWDRHRVTRAHSRVAQSCIIAAGRNSGRVGRLAKSRSTCDNLAPSP